MTSCFRPLFLLSLSILFSVCLCRTYTKTFTIGPLNVGPGLTDFFFEDIERPQGKIAVTGFHLTLADEKKEEIPLEVIYHHHTLIKEKEDNEYYKGEHGIDSYYYLPKSDSLATTPHVACAGAEGAKTPIRFPNGFGFISEADKKWNAQIVTIGLWPMVAETNKTVYAQYTLNWQEANPAGFLDVRHCYLMVLSSMDTLVFNVPAAPKYNPEEPAYFIAHREISFPYDVSIANAVGHFHINTANVTLSTPADKNFCVSTPHMNNNGYIDSIKSCIGPTLLPKDEPLSVTAAIRMGEAPFEGFMAFLMVWVSVHNDEQ